MHFDSICIQTTFIKAFYCKFFGSQLFVSIFNFLIFYQIGSFMQATLAFLFNISHRSFSSQIVYFYFVWIYTSIVPISNN